MSKFLFALVVLSVAIAVKGNAVALSKIAMGVEVILYYSSTTHTLLIYLFTCSTF